MLLFIGIILLALWLLGLVSSYTLGGFIHIALIIGLIAIVISLVSRRRLRR
ncbi:MAG TPA: lmo0937 family membrane protein [Spirochaetia bacterium]|nr:lmo0937 family membrane protein [Spirochaetia bacterium]